MITIDKFIKVNNKGNKQFAQWVSASTNYWGTWLYASQRGVLDRFLRCAHEAGNYTSGNILSRYCGLPECVNC